MNVQDGQTAIKPSVWLKMSLTLTHCVLATAT